MMGKVLIGVIVAVASLVLAESLTCNQCSASVLGVCLNANNVTCSTNTSVCFTGTSKFPSVSSFPGVSSQGCREPAGCNATTNITVIGLTLSTQITCCSTDRCNPVTITSGAPSPKMSLTAAALGATLLASVWSSVL